MNINIISTNQSYGRNQILLRSILPAFNSTFSTNYFRQIDHIFGSGKFFFTTPMDQLPLFKFDLTNILVGFFNHIFGQFVHLWCQITQFCVQFNQHFGQIFLRCMCMSMVIGRSIKMSITISLNMSWSMKISTNHELKQEGV